SGLPIAGASWATLAEGGSCFAAYCAPVVGAAARITKSTEPKSRILCKLVISPLPSFTVELRIIAVGTRIPSQKMLRCPVAEFETAFAQALSFLAGRGILKFSPASIFKERSEEHTSE